MVIAANTLIYTLLMDKAETIPSLAYTVIGVAWAYALYVYLAQPYRRYPILRSSYFTSASDSALIVLWLHATGGFQSPFYLLLYISVVAISFRYPLNETVIAALIYAVTYAGLLAASGELTEHWSDGVVRITYIFIAAMLGATISSEVLQQILSKLKLQEQLRKEEQAKLREAQDAERRSAAMALENERLFEREKLARARAEASEQHYRFLAESMPQIVWTAKPDGTIDYTNRAWSTYVGESAAAVLFTDWRKIVYPDEVANIEERWSRCLRSGEPYEAEHRLRREDGVYRWFLVRGVPMRGAQGEIARWFVTCTDVEAFKRAESELQNAIKLREDFLLIAGHELKTPLTALQLQVEGVGRLAAARGAETNLDAKVLQRLEKASGHLRRVNRMVEDLLDVSRIKISTLRN